MIYKNGNTVEFFTLLSAVKNLKQGIDWITSVRGAYFNPGPQEYFKHTICSKPSKENPALTLLVEAIFIH